MSKIDRKKQIQTAKAARVLDGIPRSSLQPALPNKERLHSERDKDLRLAIVIRASNAASNFCSWRTLFPAVPIPI